MKVAILGGTGKLGLALAFRFSKNGHETVIGSRDERKAVEAAANFHGQVVGMSNVDASAWCEASVIAIPYAGHRVLLESTRQALRGKIVVDATVPIDPANLLQTKTESGRSAAEEAAAVLDSSDVFAGFHTISHRVLRQVEVVPDTLIAGTSSRKSEVMALVRSIGLRPIDAGPLEVACHLERMTVLLLSINKTNKIKESGIKITGI
jgi:NADPH-dependent F420 reductase